MRPLKKFLGGVTVFEVPRFDDRRGSFVVTFEVTAAEAAGLPPWFVQDNRSLSHAAGTVRGLHLQLPPVEQGKLVSVTRGRVLDVFVDLRPGSDSHGRYDAVEMAADENRMLWIPPGFAHGFCTLEPETEVVYKVDAPYDPTAERTLAWDDPDLAIDWPVEPTAAVLSDKDRNGQRFGDIVAEIAVAADRQVDPRTAGHPAGVRG